MNKKILFIFFLTIFLIGFTLGIEVVLAQENMTQCQDEMFINEIPCYEITPLLNCSDYIYNITNLTDGNNSLLIENGVLYPVGDGTYTYNFTYGVGGYGVILCDGTSGKFNVLPQTNYLFFVVLICAFVLLIIWRITGDSLFEMFSGVIIIILGLYSYYNPMVVTHTFIDQLISFAFWGVGAFLLIMGGLDKFGGDE